MRTAREGEAETLRGIHRRASYIWTEDRPSLDAHPDVFGVDPGAVAAGRVRVATGEDGKPLGFASWRPAGEDAELDDLFVEPDAMRHGIGSALLGDAAEQAARAGHVHLRVIAHPRTRAFYERAGFVDVGPASTRFGPARRFALELRTLLS